MDAQRIERNRLLRAMLNGLQGERVFVAEDVGEAAFALLAKALTEMTPEQCELRLRTVERDLRASVDELQGRRKDN